MQENHSFCRRVKRKGKEGIIIRESVITKFITYTICVLGFFGVCYYYLFAEKITIGDTATIIALDGPIAVVETEKGQRYLATAQNCKHWDIARNQDKVQIQLEAKGILPTINEMLQYPLDENQPEVDIVSLDIGFTEKIKRHL